MGENTHFILSFVLTIRDDLCKAISTSTYVQSNHCGLYLVSVILQLFYLYTLSFFPPFYPRKLALRAALLRLLCFLSSDWVQQWEVQKARKERKDESLFLSLPPRLRMLLAVSGDPISGFWSHLGSLQYCCFLSCHFKPMCGYSFLLVLDSGCLNIPWSFFSPDHTSVNCLFQSLPTTLLDVLSDSCSWYCLLLYTSGSWTALGEGQWLISLYNSQTQHNVQERGCSHFFKKRSY